MTDSQKLRQQIEESLNQEQWAKTRRLLAELWREQPTPATAAYLLSRVERWRDHFPLTQCRLAILRSFTVEPAIPLLRAAAFIAGIDITVQIGQFNTFTQDILNEKSSLYQSAPDAVVLAIQTRDLVPELWINYTDFSASDIATIVERVIGDFDNWLRIFRSLSNAHLIIHGLEVPAHTSQGLLDSQLDTSQVAAIQRINAGLRQLAASYRGVYMLDYDALVARHGRISWHDELKWFSARMPIAAEHLIHLADEWLRFVHPLVGKSCKVLVTDLDNTLWGGVIGEDGMDGIQLGPEHPGAAFYALQRVMLDLYRRGILLAVCSKNNLADAMEALEKHPGMILKPEHFAALRINWQDKAQNMREIASELNVGLDTLAFLDDNPVERERIRTELPEVTVIELPDSPMDFAWIVRQTAGFERLALTDEDKERGRYYAEQRQRVEFERSASSIENFYRSLKQEIEFATVTPLTLTRIAQLTQKTNQFNLTTRRYNEQQITEMANSQAWNVYSIHVKDRFGDNGLVGVAITQDVEDHSEIDTFLLSCRVVGRTVETAILAFLIDQARRRNRKKLQGWFLPTKKNDLAKEFYSQHDFAMIKQTDNGTLWSFDLNKNRIVTPDWIQLANNVQPAHF